MELAAEYAENARKEAEARAIEIAAIEKRAAEEHKQKEEGREQMVADAQARMADLTFSFGWG